jgi:hypothetical protein
MAAAKSLLHHWVENETWRPLSPCPITGPKMGLSGRQVPSNGLKPDLAAHAHAHAHALYVRHLAIVGWNAESLVISIGMVWHDGMQDEGSYTCFNCSEKPSPCLFSFTINFDFHSGGALERDWNLNPKVGEECSN